MLKYLLFSATLFALSSLATDPSALTAQGLRKLYGEPTMERFTAGNGVTLTVEYGEDGGACQFLIAPAQLLIEVQDPNSPPISSRAVGALLEEVIPLETRGKQTNSTTIEVSGKTLLKTDYENVSIRRICYSKSCVSSADKQDFHTLVVFKRAACPKHIE